MAVLVLFSLWLQGSDSAIPTHAHDHQGLRGILQLSGQAYRSASSPMEREPLSLAAAGIRAFAESSNAWRPGRSRHAHSLAV
eukprot:4807488-Pleurochrysis_carterae.AAC.1